jgi:hypothetical protein
MMKLLELRNKTEKEIDRIIEDRINFIYVTKEV